MKWRHKVMPPLEAPSSPKEPDEGALRAAEALRCTTLNAYDGEFLTAELGAIRREIQAARLTDRRP